MSPWNAADETSMSRYRLAVGVRMAETTGTASHDQNFSPRLRASGLWDPCRVPSRIINRTMEIILRATSGPPTPSQPGYGEQLSAMQPLAPCWRKKCAKKCAFPLPSPGVFIQHWSAVVSCSVPDCRAVSSSFRPLRPILSMVYLEGLLFCVFDGTAVSI